MNRLFQSQWPRISLITLRILAVNVGALLILGLGLLYSGQYERELIKTELNALSASGRLLAAALAEGGTRENASGDRELAEDLARHMLRKLSEENAHRTIIFTKTGALALDSHQLLGPGGVVEMIELEAPFATWTWRRKTEFLIQKALDILPTRFALAPFPRELKNRAQGYPGLLEALNGTVDARAWRDGDGKILLTVSLPIQNLKNVMGAVLLMQKDGGIDLAVRDMQLTVLRLFFYALLVTILLTAYLSETIAVPILRLAQAATLVKKSLLFKDAIPDFSYRKDEIGTLSSAFKEMTAALSERIDAISRFASDVAHEIKNPLASVKSAVETLSVVKDEAQRQKLLLILNEDIDRLNRLITDISNASRLDGEIGRAEKKSLDMNLLIAEAVRQESEKRQAQNRIYFTASAARLPVTGNDVQLYQVMRNLIDNAFSFLSESGRIDISAGEEQGKIVVRIDNDGPPIPEEKREAIFARFYTERPKGEKFGLHSGLGLSISRQIVTAHQGTLFAENLKDGKGVRFTIVLPKGA